jgi:hypothetical protein
MAKKRRTVSGKPSVCLSLSYKYKLAFLIVWTSCHAKDGNDDNHHEVSVVSDYSYCLRTESMSKGDQVQRDVYAWLSPPDPSTNHNIACEAHHNGTAQWFIQGSTLSEWKASGSLLWIYGIRSFLEHCVHPLLVLTSRFIAGSGKSILWYVVLKSHSHKRT